MVPARWVYGVPQFCFERPFGGHHFYLSEPIPAARRRHFHKQSLRDLVTCLEKEDPIMFHCGKLTYLNYQVDSPDRTRRIVRIIDPEWTHDAHLPLRSAANEAVCLEVDLSQVRKMCTAAFAELLILKQHLARHGCEMRLQGFQPQPRALCCVLKLAELLGLDELSEETFSPSRSQNSPSGQSRKSTRNFRSPAAPRWTAKAATLRHFRKTIR